MTGTAKEKDPQPGCPIPDDRGVLPVRRSEEG